MSKGICIVEGCGKREYRNGFCYTHNFNPEFNKRSKCSVEWCKTPVYAKGFCHTHYTQVRKTGRVCKNRFTPNEFEIKDGYAEIVLCDPYGNEKARGKLDIADIELVSGIKWCLNSYGYVYNSHKKKTFMHNLILGCLYVDHVNRNTLDNRRGNLRKATPAENARNSGVSSNNTIGYKGLTVTKRGRFVAKLQPKSGQIYVGTFDTAEEAALAYNIAAKKHYGEFAYQNEL